MSIFGRLVIYALLILGSAVFSLPFLWMVTTSAKVDRELFSTNLRILPVAPRPRAVSPYVDETFFAESATEPAPPAMVSALADLVRTQLTDVPDDMDREQVVRETAVGLYYKLRRLLPDSAWQHPPEAIVAAAREQVTPRLVADLFGDIHRRFCFGQVRVRSQGLQEEELGAGQPFDQRLENQTPTVAHLVERAEKTIRYASVDYDFGRGDRVTLSRTFTLGFEARDLQRIQLYMKPDDTWHELWLTVERAGQRFVCERPVPMANANWTMVTWQEPGPDDLGTKIRTWVRLRTAPTDGLPSLDARQLRLTFELRRSSPLRAWWNKVRLNYDRVLDHIPFWRYVATSVFLVVVSIVLTLFSCSLVAYAFARLQWPGRDFCFVLMLATMMIPGQVTMIPHFLIWKNLGLYNTLTPLWLGHAFGSAFFVFLLRQFLKGIPRDLEDAARIDGCGFLRIYWHIMLPLVKPSLAAIAIFTFMGTWNDFMGPLVYIADQRLYPLAFGLYAFAVQVGNNPALTMAASLLMTLPVIIIFFFAQKYFIQGVTLTGIKG